jgi:pimeloyl-ACP methyl ester carboxylesterase
MRKLVVVAAAVSMLAGGLGAVAAPAVAATSHPSAATAHSSASSSAISWGACTDPFLIQAGAQCALLNVPLNYNKPMSSSNKVQIAVSIIRHTSNQAHYKGILLTNPGGPGGSGLNLNVFLIEQLQAEAAAAKGAAKSWDNAAVKDYDWVGFDPRGVGSSVPALTCEPYYFHGNRRNYNPKTSSLTSYWLTRTKQYDHACETHSAAQAALLKHMKTKDVARDMNSIRKVLGQKKINYYGFSYGTYLGQVYSSMFPHKVRRLIMDSNVDPRKVWYQANLDQDVAFQRNINIWFKWLAKYHKVYHVGNTEAAARRRFNHEEALVAKHPISGQVGRDEWVDIFLEAGYYQLTWLQLGQAYSDWATTHSASAGATLVSLFKSTDGVGDDNEFAVYNGVQCTDTQWPTSFAKWRRDNTRVNKIAPFETWGNAWFNAPCLDWPAKAGKPEHINGKHVSSALLIDETKDAATPFPGSLETRKLYPHSVLLAEPGGTTHADSLFGDLCVDNTIARYLANGHLPKRDKHAAWDKTCKPLPVPNPTMSMSPAQKAASNRLLKLARRLTVRG